MAAYADGLGVSNKTPKQVENIKKKICKVFNENGLKVTVDANKKVVQFLDVELNLRNGSFKPFLKPNDNPLYVNVSSSHPHSVTKNIPLAVNRRLCALSSDENMFNSVAQIYQDALKNAGYTHVLKYTPTAATEKKKTRKRYENMLWFNPPYSQNVKTNVGAKFLKLISKHFPKSNPPWMRGNNPPPQSLANLKPTWDCAPPRSRKDGQIIGQHLSTQQKVPPQL